MQRAQAKESSDSLEKNTQALVRQADALQRLVATAEERESRAINPVFRLYWQQGVVMPNDTLQVVLENKGHDVAEFVLYATKREQTTDDSYRDGDAILNGTGFLAWFPTAMSLRTQISAVRGANSPIRIRLTFMRVDGTSGEQTFESYMPNSSSSFNPIDLR